MTTRDRVRRFILENFYVAEPDELGDDTSLIESGFVDSTGMLEIIAFLEAECAVVVADTETTPENLGSIARIAAFVAGKAPAAVA